MDAATAVTTTATVVNAIGVSNTLKIATALANSQQGNYDDGDEKGVISTTASSISNKAKDAASSVIDFVKGKSEVAAAEGSFVEIGIPPSPIPLPWAPPVPCLAPIDSSHSALSASSSTITTSSWVSALSLNPHQKKDNEALEHPYVTTPPPLPQLMEKFTSRLLIPLTTQSSRVSRTIVNVKETITTKLTSNEVVGWHRGDVACVGDLAFSCFQADLAVVLSLLEFEHALGKLSSSSFGPGGVTIAKIYNLIKKQIDTAAPSRWSVEGLDCCRYIIQRVSAWRNQVEAPPVYAPKGKKGERKAKTNIVYRQPATSWSLIKSHFSYIEPFLRYDISLIASSIGTVEALTPLLQAASASAIGDALMMDAPPPSSPSSLLPPSSPFTPPDDAQFNADRLVSLAMNADRCIRFAIGREEILNTMLDRGMQYDWRFIVAVYQYRDTLWSAYASSYSLSGAKPLFKMVTSWSALKSGVGAMVKRAIDMPPYDDFKRVDQLLITMSSFLGSSSDALHQRLCQVDWLGSDDSAAGAASLAAHEKLLAANKNGKDAKHDKDSPDRHGNQKKVASPPQWSKLSKKERNCLITTGPPQDLNLLETWLGPTVQFSPQLLRIVSHHLLTRLPQLLAPTTTLDPARYGGAAVAGAWRRRIKESRMLVGMTAEGVWQGRDNIAREESWRFSDEESQPEHGWGLENNHQEGRSTNSRDFNYYNVTVLLSTEDPWISQVGRFYHQLADSELDD